MSIWNHGISPSDLMAARAIADAAGLNWEYIGFHWDDTKDCWELWYFPPEAIAAGAYKVAFACNTEGVWKEV